MDWRVKRRHSAGTACAGEGTCAHPGWPLQAWRQCRRPRPAKPCSARRIGSPGQSNGRHGGCNMPNSALIVHVSGEDNSSSLKARLTFKGYGVHCVAIDPANGRIRWHPDARQPARSLSRAIKGSEIVAISVGTTDGQQIKLSGGAPVSEVPRCLPLADARFSSSERSSNSRALKAQVAKPSGKIPEVDHARDRAREIQRRFGVDFSGTVPKRNIVSREEQRVSKNRGQSLSGG